MTPTPAEELLELAADLELYAEQLAAVPGAAVPAVNLPHLAATARRLAGAGGVASVTDEEVNAATAELLEEMFGGQYVNVSDYLPPRPGQTREEALAAMRAAESELEAELRQQARVALELARAHR